LTPQEEQLWNKDGATDIDDEDLVKHDNLIESQEHTHNYTDTLISSEEEKESKEDESQMNSLVSSNKVARGSTRPLKRVETDSFTAETLAISRTVCGRKSKEYFDGAKTIAERIPCIVGSSTKLKLSETVVSLQKRGQEYDNVSRCLPVAGDDVANGGIIMSVLTALSIEKLVNIRESFTRQAKRKFPYDRELHVREKLVCSVQTCVYLMMMCTHGTLDHYFWCAGMHDSWVEGLWQEPRLSCVHTHT
jgi:hypothetical protein